MAKSSIRYLSPSVALGFHGTTTDIAKSVIQDGGSLKTSSNSYDWLGHGIYFWEGSYDRALQWARRHHGEYASVVGAFIKFGNCMDLLDTHWTENLRETYDVLLQELEQSGQELPKNLSKDTNGITFKRDLDCRVIMHLQSLYEDTIALDLGFEAGKYTPTQKKLIQTHPFYIDSVRGMFPEGNELYPNAGFRDRNHIQICIRNPNCIIGYFDPRETDARYKTL